MFTGTLDRFIRAIRNIFTPEGEIDRNKLPLFTEEDEPFFDVQATRWAGTTAGVAAIQAVAGEGGAPVDAYTKQESDERFAPLGQAGGAALPLILCSVVAGTGAQLYNATLARDAFSVVPIGTIVTDTHNGYDTSTSIYTVPEPGYYNITTKLRLRDGNGNGSGLGYAQGPSLTNADGAQMMWFVTAPNRNSSFNEWTTWLDAGDLIRLVYYLDGFTVGQFGAEMIIRRISV